MNRRKPLSFWIAVLVLTGLLLTPVAVAGPPLICWPFDIGNAPSLPWGAGGWKTPRPGYNTASLASDTLALLTAQTPVIVRMETLRRATIYASQNSLAAQELLSALKTRALSAEAQGRADALAWFDAGYLVETYKQLSVLSGHREMTPAPDGYAWVKNAIQLRNGDPDMEFAAALIAGGRTRRAQRDAHWRKAIAGATDDSLLGRNLVSHAPLMGVAAASVAELRAQLGAEKGTGAVAK